jgi:hypothetical protein
MKLDHFENHKRKYISFIIIAILVVYATYLVVKSEAQTGPFMQNTENIIGDDIGPNCPKIFRYFPRFFMMRHPCMRGMTVSPTVINQPLMTTSVDTQETVTSENATSTTETASSTDTEAATSTQDEATSTPAQSQEGLPVLEATSSASVAE